ncbi:MAG: hypothetical protein WD040_02080, partial [Anaerolineales bacterium]
MTLLRRLLLLPVGIALANFLGYSYARIAGGLRPWDLAADGRPILFAEYGEYARRVLRFDLGPYPVGAGQPIAEVLGKAAQSSLGLAGLAFLLSAVLGLMLGMAAVRIRSARLAPWMVPVSTIGLATPSF